MISIRRVGAAVFLLSLYLSAQQQEPMVVSLTVKHNGRKKPAPDHVTLSFAGHSVQIPVRDGQFEVPPEIISAKEVTFAADVEGDHIRVLDLPGKKFTQEDWTLLLEDRKYDEAYQWIVPRGAAIHSSCILSFDSVHTDPGTFVFVPHCRSRLK